MRIGKACMDTRPRLQQDVDPLAVYERADKHENRFVGGQSQLPTDTCAVVGRREVTGVDALTDQAHLAGSEPRLEIFFLQGWRDSHITVAAAKDGPPQSAKVMARAHQRHRIVRPDKGGLEQQGPAPPAAPEPARAQCIGHGMGVDEVEVRAQRQVARVRAANAAPRRRRQTRVPASAGTSQRRRTTRYPSNSSGRSCGPRPW